MFVLIVDYIGAGNILLLVVASKTKQKQETFRLSIILERIKTKQNIPTYKKKI
jgi:hypothetical protein